MTVILAVAQDSMIQETRGCVLRTNGYLVVSAWSTTDAISRFREGDFDLVLLCHSIPSPDKELLIRQIRATGSLVPILCVAPISDRVAETFGTVMIGSQPGELLRGIEKALNGAATRLSAHAEDMPAF